MKCLFAMSILFAGFGNAHAEGNAISLPIEAPAGLTKMLDEFSRLLDEGDKKGLDRLCKFPLKNIVYGERRTKSKKEFESAAKKRLPGFCYGAKKPEKDERTDQWILDCDGNIFYFGQISGAWKYLGYENINE